MLTGFASAAILSGFAVGIGLVLSIGPQNLLLIRSGANARHGWVTATTGYCSEILIFLVAISSLGTILREASDVTSALYTLGTGFLIWCGLRTFRKSDLHRHGQQHAQGQGPAGHQRPEGLPRTWMVTGLVME